jgi:hypothetical protein
MGLKLALHAGSRGGYHGIDVSTSAASRRGLMDPRDLSGKRGEFIASTRLLDFCGNPIPYFAPQPLDGKFPTYDLLVELTHGGTSKPYFFAQVKTTRPSGAKKRRSLKAELSAADVKAMIVCPIPTYLIGVDEVAEVAYILSIHGPIKGGIGTIPTTYPLDAGNLKVLHDEVSAYWKTLALSSKSKTSVFVR